MIFSYSFSAITKLGTVNFEESYVRLLQHELWSFKMKGQKVELCWVPTHIGIDGNEKANKSAKRSIARHSTMIPLPYIDYVYGVKNSVERKWKTAWTEANAKMRCIKPEAGSWEYEKRMKRLLQVKLNMLRVGHTLLIHCYLMETVQQGSPGCPLCMTSLLCGSHSEWMLSAGTKENNLH